MSNFKDIFKNIFIPKNTNDYDFTIDPNIKEQCNLEENSNKKPQTIFPSIDVSLEYIKVKYNTMINSDIVLREFTLNARNRQYKAFLLFIDGMVNSDFLNNNVLTPLMLRNRANTFESDQTQILSEAKTNNITVRKIKKFDIKEYIKDCLLPQNNLTILYNFDEVLDNVNLGSCALFVDTLDIAYNIDVKGFKQRSVQPPTNEIVIRGAQEAFTEVLRTNTSLLRRFVNNENLIIETVSVGKLSKTPCSICYLNNVANSDLVAETKFRLNNINVDYILSSGQLETLIEDTPSYSLPQIIATERPDRVSGYLLEGRVAIIVNGSPYVLVVPGILTDFLSSPEDNNLKYQFANLLKGLRVLGLFITLLLPALYIAITNFHLELIPTELLFAMVSARSTVPFPIIIELLIMEIAFELIREGGLRVPSPIGPTIGIVGALILGQAAVEANIVSPILIIIVATTAISSFVIPDFSLSFHCRVTRFIYIILAYLAGFLGIAIGLCIHLFMISNLKSFGVSYLEPYIPSDKNVKNGIFLAPSWKREKRHDFLNTKRENKQSHYSMGWKYYK